MPNILIYLLGIILLILIMIMLFFLGLHIRFKQLENEKYTHEERFKIVSWIASWAVPLLFRAKIEATGLEYLEQAKTGVLFPNHQSWMDTAILLNLVKRPHGYVAKKELEQIILLSAGMRLIRCEFIDREDLRQSIKVISSAAKKVKEGHLMVIYPEGRRVIQGELGLFKPGSFKIAQKAKADVIPVTIYNSYEISRRFPKRTVVKIKIHPPISYEQYEHLSTKEISEKVEKIVKSQL